MQHRCGRLPAICLGILSIGEYQPFLLFYICTYIYIYFFIRFMHFCLAVAVAAAENCISWLAAMKRQQQHVLCSPLWPLDISLGRDNAPQPNQAIIKAGPAI